MVGQRRDLIIAQIGAFQRSLFNRWGAFLIGPPVEGKVRVYVWVSYA